MTFQQVMQRNRFELQNPALPRFASEALPTIGRRDEYYRQVDGEGRATVSMYDDGTSSLLAALQTGPDDYTYVGYWDNPFAALLELPQKLLTSACAGG